METLAERVTHARSLTGMKAVDFARAIKVGRAAVSKMERGYTQTVNLSTALEIQRVSGVSAAWLQTGKGPIMFSQSRDDQITRILDKIQLLPPQLRDRIESEVDFLNSLK